MGFAERLRIAIGEETDPNEVRKRTEEALLEHDVRQTHSAYLDAAHEAISNDKDPRGDAVGDPTE